MHCFRFVADRFAKLPNKAEFRPVRPDVETRRFQSAGYEARVKSLEVAVQLNPLDHMDRKRFLQTPCLSMVSRRHA